MTILPYWLSFLNQSYWVSKTLELFYYSFANLCPIAKNSLFFKCLMPTSGKKTNFKRNWLGKSQIIQIHRVIKNNQRPKKHKTSSNSMKIIAKNAYFSKICSACVKITLNVWDWRNKISRTIPSSLTNSSNRREICFCSLLNW